MQFRCYILHLLYISFYTIRRDVEDKAFSPSYDMAPPTSPLSLISKLDRRHTGRLRKRDNLLTGKRGRSQIM